MMERKAEFVVCIRNDGFAASLEPRKLYRVEHDPQSEQHGLVRVIDESGEGYLYPAEFFLAIELPEAVEEALALAS